MTTHAHVPHSGVTNQTDRSAATVPREREPGQDQPTGTPTLNDDLAGGDGQHDADENDHGQDDAESTSTETINVPDTNIGPPDAKQPSLEPTANQPAADTDATTPENFDLFDVAEERHYAYPEETIHTKRKEFLDWAFEELKLSDLFPDDEWQPLWKLCMRPYFRPELVSWIYAASGRSEASREQRMNQDSSKKVELGSKIAFQHVLGIHSQRGLVEIRGSGDEVEYRRVLVAPATGDETAIQPDTNLLEEKDGQIITTTGIETGDLGHDKPRDVPKPVSQSDALDPLVGLAESINRNHSRSKDCTNRALDYAHEAGKGLLDAKEQVDHGAWEAWVKENCHFSLRTAQKYMRVAEQWEKLQAKAPPRTAHLAVEAALRMLKKDERDGRSKAARQPPGAAAATRIGQANAAAMYGDRSSTATSEQGKNRGESPAVGSVADDEHRNGPKGPGADPPEDRGGPQIHTEPDPLGDIKLDPQAARLGNPGAYVLSILKDGEAHQFPDSSNIPLAAALQAYVFACPQLHEQQRRLEQLKQAAALHRYIGLGRELILHAVWNLCWAGLAELGDDGTYRLTKEGLAAAETLFGSNKG